MRDHLLFNFYCSHELRESSVLSLSLNHFGGDLVLSLGPRFAGLVGRIALLAEPFFSELRLAAHDFQTTKPSLVEI